MNPNQIINAFGGFQNFQKQFNMFANNFKSPNNLTPQQLVQNALNSGKMTQEQFDQYRQIANQLTGKNF